MLDSTRTDFEAFGPRGSIDEEQWDWLEDRLRAYNSRYLFQRETTPQGPGGPHVWVWDIQQHNVEDKLIVLFSHHTIDTMTNDFDLPFGGHHFGGQALKNQLWRFPNVILLVNGHKHSNNVWAHARPAWTTPAGVSIPGGFWEVNTASHIDWPIQSRLIEIAESSDILSIYTTMLDIDAPLSNGGDTSSPDMLAALARELAANDIQGSRDGARGELNARNTQLLVPSPIRFLLVQPVANATIPVNTPYSLTLTTTKGAGPFSWSATGLPPGLSINRDTGTISGTPSQTGTYPITYRVNDLHGHTANAAFTLTVAVPVPDVKGKLPAAASATIQNAGLNPFRLLPDTTVWDSSDAGKVISQSPGAGALVASGSTVQYAVGKWGGANR